MTTVPPVTFEAPAGADEHLRDNETRVRSALASVTQSSRGRLLPPIGVGFDPEGHANRAWWARAHLNVGRFPGQRVTVDGYPSGVEALEALAETVDGFMVAHGITRIG